MEVPAAAEGDALAVPAKPIAPPTDSMWIAVEI